MWNAFFTWISKLLLDYISLRLTGGATFGNILFGIYITNYFYRVLWFVNHIFKYKMQYTNSVFEGSGIVKF